MNNQSAKINVAPTIIASDGDQEGLGLVFGADDTVNFRTGLKRF